MKSFSAKRLKPSLVGSRGKSAGRHPCRILASCHPQKATQSQSYAKNPKPLNPCFRGNGLPTWPTGRHKCGKARDFLRGRLVWFLMAGERQ